MKTQNKIVNIHTVSLILSMTQFTVVLHHLQMDLMAVEFTYMLSQFTMG
jgi:hypothetical protein